MPYAAPLAVNGKDHVARTSRDSEEMVAYHVTPILTSSPAEPQIFPNHKTKLTYLSHKHFSCVHLYNVKHGIGCVCSFTYLSSIQLNVKEYMVMAFCHRLCLE